MRLLLPSSILALGLLLCAAPATAQDDDELYKTKNCFACHKVDRSSHGPMFKAMAAKYAGAQGAEAKALEERLVKKVREGGVGVWGPMPMPPQPQVTEEEARRLVRWILALPQ